MKTILLEGSVYQGLIVLNQEGNQSSCKILKTLRHICRFLDVMRTTYFWSGVKTS